MESLASKWYIYSDCWEPSQLCIDSSGSVQCWGDDSDGQSSPPMFFQSISVGLEY